VWDALQLEFMRNAVTAGLLVSLVCGVLGTLVVVNRIVFISGGIAHAAYGGIGLGLYFGVSPALGATLFSVAVSMVMGVASIKSRERADTIIGVMWALGMALGIIFTELTPGYNVDLMSYLFGSILSVPGSDIWYMLCLNLVVLLFVFYFYKELVAMSYDEEFSFVVGIPARALYFVLLGLISLSVVMIIRVVGLILVIALLTIPPFIAEKIHGLPRQNDGARLPPQHSVHPGRLVGLLPVQPCLRRDDYHCCRLCLLCFTRNRCTGR